MESPLTQLGRIEKEWRGIWSKGRPCVSSLNIEARQGVPITVDAFKAACTSFDIGTAVGTDGIRPRHLLHLPDVSLQILAGILNLSELTGSVPVLGAHVVFLPKPTGGERPIGILPTLCRVCCRCRRHVAQAWERAFQRPYCWAAAERSSEQAVHHQGICVELARASGQHAPGLLKDLAKAYEHVDHGKLAQFAAATGFHGRST